jgi:predicted ATP-grasp superfamily ATP-dependent carboligase
VEATVVLLDPNNGGLAAARSLVRAGRRVAVVATPENGFTARTRRGNGQVVGTGGWLAALETIAARGPAHVLTGGDVTSAWLAENAGRLPAGVRAFETQDGAHLPLMAKDSADAIARRAGVLVPWTATVAGEAELATAVAEAPYPAILKPVLSHAWRAKFGDDRVILVDGPDAARSAGQRALDAGLPMVMSEFVPGGDDCVQEALVVRSAEGDYPVHFGCRKIRQYPVGFGAASLCEAAELPETMALARAVLDEAGFVGVAGVETKRHAETGRHYFIEVNVRIATQWGLGDASGLDASRRLAATLAGERLGPQGPMRRSARLVFPELELRAALAALRAVPPGRRPGVALRLAGSYRGVRDVGVLDVRDPLPGITYAARALRRRVRS